MKICILSVHPLQDNRIHKMITTVKNPENEILYVNISTQTDFPRGWFDGITIIQFPVPFRKKNILKLLPILLETNRIIQQEKPDVVHVHDPYLIPLLVTAKRVGAITVYDKHEAYEVMRGFAAATGAWCEKRFNCFIDGIVYVAKVQEPYINQFPYLSKRLVPNYQSAKLYSSASVAPHEGIRVFYAGDLGEESRNTMLMLELIEKLLSSHKTITCTIAGEIFDNRVAEKINELQNMNANFKYRDYLLYDDVTNETCNADIGMYLTKYDPNNIGSSPNKINEYLLAGVAILAQGRFQDWELMDNTVGFVFNYDDSFDTIYSGLAQMVENRSLLQSMKNHSAELGKSRTWESVEGRYLDLYAEIKSKLKKQ